MFDAPHFGFSLVKYNTSNAADGPSKRHKNGCCAARLGDSLGVWMDPLISKYWYSSACSFACKKQHKHTDRVHSQTTNICFFGHGFTNAPKGACRPLIAEYQYPSPAECNILPKTSTNMQCFNSTDAFLAVFTTT